MMKPRTLVLIAAAGVSAFLVWRWQRQRLINFDQNLFSDNSETQRSLAPGFSIQKNESSEGPSKRRPIQTTVYKGEPGKHSRAPTAVYQSSTNNHVETPAPAPAAPAPPAVADEADTAINEDSSTEEQPDDSTETPTTAVEAVEAERPS